MGIFIVSACLLGENCKYSGGNNRNQAVIDFLSDKEFVPVCPEVLGGLETPRAPSEYANDGSDRIINTDGVDVTTNFELGAKRSLEIAREKAREGAGEFVGKIEGAILKGKSPSCGSNKIYDGTFSGKLMEGDGCFVRLLKKEGIKVVSEKEIEKYGKF